MEHARVAKQKTSRDSIQPMIYLQTIITFVLKCVKSSKYVQLTRVKNYIQFLFTNIYKKREKTIYKLKTENFKCLVEWC